MLEIYWSNRKNQLWITHLRFPLVICYVPYELRIYCFLLEPIYQMKFRKIWFLCRLFLHPTFFFSFPKTICQDSRVTYCWLRFCFALDSVSIHFNLIQLNCGNWFYIKLSMEFIYFSFNLKEAMILRLRGYTNSSTKSLVLLKQFWLSILPCHQSPAELNIILIHWRKVLISFEMRSWPMAFLYFKLTFQSR